MIRLLNDIEYNEVWNKVYSELGFNPSVNILDIPFKMNKSYQVYDINKMTLNMMMKIIL